MIINPKKAREEIYGYLVSRTGIHDEVMRELDGFIYDHSDTLETETEAVIRGNCRHLVPESNVFFAITNMGIVTAFLLPSVYALAMLVYDAATQQVPSCGDVAFALGGLFLTAAGAITGAITGAIAASSAATTTIMSSVTSNMMNTQNSVVVECILQKVRKDGEWFGRLVPSLKKKLSIQEIVKIKKK